MVGKQYWLYRRIDGSFQLSLIAPQEWRGAGFGQFVGECMLQKDITWSLMLDAEAAKDNELHLLIENRRRQFEDALHGVDTVEQILPVYLASLPFYQRLFASALANSLSVSMQKSGIQGLSYNQAKGLLSKM